MNKFVCALFLIATISSNFYLIKCEQAVQQTDTYLKALADTNNHGKAQSNNIDQYRRTVKNEFEHETNLEFIIGREDNGFGQNYPSGTGIGYDIQTQHAQHFKPHYGPPPVYGPPQPQYGPPHGAYGPPLPPSGYGPPPTGYGVGTPYFAPGGHWLLDKFKIKMDLFTIGKILLKLLIFKKIVKFMALICLLLVLPKFKHDSGEGGHSSQEENYRNIEDKDAFINERLNEVTNFAMTALKAFSQKNIDKSCGNNGQLRCRFERMFNTVDQKYPYERILKLYSTDVNPDVGVSTGRRSKMLKHDENSGGEITN